MHARGTDHKASPQVHGPISVSQPYLRCRYYLTGPKDHTHHVLRSLPTAAHLVVEEPKLEKERVAKPRG